MKKSKYSRQIAPWACFGHQMLITFASAVADNLVNRAVCNALLFSVAAIALFGLGAMMLRTSLFDHIGKNFDVREKKTNRSSLLSYCELKSRQENGNRLFEMKMRY